MGCTAKDRKHWEFGSGYCLRLRGCWGGGNTSFLISHLTHKDKNSIFPPESYHSHRTINVQQCDMVTLMKRDTNAHAHSWCKAATRFSLHSPTSYICIHSVWTVSRDVSAGGLHISNLCCALAINKKNDCVNKNYTYWHEINIMSLINCTDCPNWIRL